MWAKCKRHACVADNHDLISLKLYQLTVLRSKLEEEEEEEEIKVPSVDNVDLMKRMCPAKSVFWCVNKCLSLGALWKKGERYIVAVDLVEN